MPPSSYLHILRNISDELDWRPVHFVDRLHPAWICNACGIVVRRTGLLPCRHCLCGPCYQQQCDLGGSLSCPLDGEACPEVNVVWSEGLVKNLLKLQVYCWNKDNGCSTMVAASELSRHFGLECKHHLVACPKCSTRTLYNSLGLHLRSCTGRQGPGLGESAQGAGDNEQTAELADLKMKLSTATRQVKEELLELKDRFDMLFLEGNMQAEQVNALSHAMNDLKEVQTDQGNTLACTMNDVKETLQHDLETVASQNRDSIARHAADVGTVKDTVVETGRETFQKMDLILRHLLRTESSHQWILKGYGSLKAKAMRLGSTDRCSKPVYLCHYFILPGVYLKRAGHEVSLHLQVCVQRGEVDEYIQWPFNRKMELSVVHPDTGAKRTIEGSPTGRRDFYSRPTSSCNATFYVNACLYLKDLEWDGYVKSDQLDLCFALLN